MTRTALLWGGAGLLVLLSAACGKPKPEPLVPVEVTSFQQLYGENCAGCHGVDGAHGAAQPLNNAAYLAFIPKEELRKVTANGVPGSLMPGFSQSSGGDLSERQVSIVADGIEKWAKPSDVETAGMPPYTAISKGDATAGAQIFHAACASCHGQGGSAGSITDSSFLQLATDQSLRTTTIVGRSDLGMPDWRHVERSRALTGVEVDNLVAYLSSQRTESVASDQAPAQPESSGGNK
ncbi:MAG TPA: c-type cytochrome [Bryobacteraceae bacterium]|jgi:cytochrome c oxidase cbb3-type subunit 3/ubiquinol-cytochrome c reductase cytochrome c subunit|nr:c-type cytochrome [Bryobacteraceae bacterium]